MFAGIYRASLIICVVCVNLFSGSHEMQIHDQAVGRLIFLPLSGLDLTQEERCLLEYIQPGGIVLYQWNVQSSEQLKKLIADVKQCVRNHQPIICADLEGGLVFRLKPIMPVPPAARAVAQSSAMVAEELAYQTAAMVHQLGIDLILGPDLDVDTAGCAVGNVRTFSNDPELVTTYGLATIRGYQRAGMTYSPKHFPGHGRAHQDSHLEGALVEGSLQEWQAHDLPPFLASFQDAPALMSAHLLNQALDATALATHSARISGLAREYGFTGALMTDSLTMDGATSSAQTVAGGALQALQAGHDILLFGGSRLLSNNSQAYHQEIRDTFDSIKQALCDQTIPIQRLCDSIAKIDALKQKPLQIAGDATALQAVINTVVENACHAVKLCEQRAQLAKATVMAVAAVQWELEAALKDYEQSPAMLTYFKPGDLLTPADLPAAAEVIILSLGGQQHDLIRLAKAQGCRVHLVELGLAQELGGLLDDLDSYVITLSPDQTSIAYALQQILAL